MNRRRFLQAACGVAGAAVAVPTLGACWGFAESTHVAITRPTISVPRLPQAFRGFTIAFLTDIHFGPFVSREYVASLVRTTAALEADLIVLGGDYTHRSEDAVEPCFEMLAGLQAPSGVVGVLGNHDYMGRVERTQTAMKKAGVHELTNEGTWLERGSDRLKLAGIDDLWYGKPDVRCALGDAKSNDICLLVSHNPDVAETLSDRRVSLMLSGHTHGGQVALPGFRGAFTPSRYGGKYAQGLVAAPKTQIYVSAGTGMSVVPIRINCRPEIALITLV